MNTICSFCGEQFPEDQHHKCKDPYQDPTLTAEYLEGFAAGYREYWSGESAKCPYYDKMLDNWYDGWMAGFNLADTEDMGYDTLHPICGVRDEPI